MTSKFSKGGYIVGNSKDEDNYVKALFATGEWIMTMKTFDNLTIADVEKLNSYNINKDFTPGVDCVF